MMKHCRVCVNEMIVYEKKLDFTTALQKAEEYLEMYPDVRRQKERAFLRSRVG